MCTEITYLNSVQDVISFFDSLLIDKSKKFVFRGYSKEEQMIPKIIEKYSIEDEFKLIDNFEKYALSYINNITSPLDLLSYAQHFGLPTRLLDFTYNPYIAIYFAVYHQYSSTVNDEYRYIRYCNLNENIHFNNLPLASHIGGLSSNGISLSKDYQRIIAYLERAVYNNQTKSSYLDLQFYDGAESLLTRNLTEQESQFGFCHSNKEKFENRKILFIEPNLSNPRIVLQQGLFLFPYITDKEIHKNIISSNTKKIAIHKTLRNDILKYLDSLGINTFKIMPDLESICAEIVRRELK